MGRPEEGSATATVPAETKETTAQRAPTPFDCESGRVAAATEKVGRGISGAEEKQDNSTRVAKTDGYDMNTSFDSEARTEIATQETRNRTRGSHGKKWAERGRASERQRKTSTLKRAGAMHDGDWRALPSWGAKKKSSMRIRRKNPSFTCHHLRNDEHPFNNIDALVVTSGNKTDRGIQGETDLSWTTNAASQSKGAFVIKKPAEVAGGDDINGNNTLCGAKTATLSSPRCSSRRKKPLLPSLIEESDEELDNKQRRNEARRPSIAFAGDKAISRSGYTCRGRVKQKAQKCVELVRVGQLKVLKGWFNAGYIFPLGFRSKTRFKSSVRLDSVCIHECEIVKGEFWPLPTFVITAHDRPDEKLVSKSCTGCWSMVLARINNEIKKRRRRGEKLPPPPKTAIAGPEYFGLIQSNVLRKIEALDPEKKCDLYWKGKLDRQVATENLPHLGDRKANGRTKRRKQQDYCSDEEDEEDEVAGDGEDSESACYTLSKWSVLGRFDRYKRRCMDKGSCPALAESDENPLPGMKDLLTMETVVTPAISPYGHVLGIATWRAWLSENRVCPFTRNPLSVEQCTILTKNNIDKYRDKIIQ